MPEIIDISVLLHPHMPVWPGNAGLQVVPVKRMSAGEENNLSRLECGLHTGTHVDAPWHFVEGGSTSDLLSLDVMIGKAVVFYLPETDAVTAEVLAGLRLPKDTFISFTITCLPLSGTRGTPPVQ